MSDYYYGYGSCPKCHDDDGFVNIGRSNFIVCHIHRLCWWAGENVCEGWRDESHAQWARNADIIDSYWQLRGDEIYYAPEGRRADHE